MTRAVYLRESRARQVYVCDICSQNILYKAIYYRDEPHPMARYYRGDKIVRHICYECVHGHPFDPQAVVPCDEPNGQQLTLPFGDSALVAPTQVLVIDATDNLIQLLRVDPDLIYKIGPEKGEDVIDNRLRAAGLETKRVGSTRRPDGGIDLLFWPSQQVLVPFLGACQVKFHERPSVTTGSPVVRDFGGALNALGLHLGLLVTNTTFTPDGIWVAKQMRGLIHLRDIEDLRRWIMDNFTDEAEWREIPSTIEVCPGLVISVRQGAESWRNRQAKDCEASREEEV